jgi:hypothetical protein
MQLHSASHNRRIGFDPCDGEFQRLVAAARVPHPRSENSRAFQAAEWGVPAGIRAQLVLLDEQGKAGSVCPIEVQDFDKRGITFRHPQPLSSRRVLVVLEGIHSKRIAAEVDLSWCRFSGRGQYTSGGRFVSPLGKTA